MIKNKNILVCVLMAVFGGWLNGAHAMTEASIAERLKPVGEVCVQGQPCAAAGASTGASGGAAGARTGHEIVNKFCSVCHATGLLNAPKIGDSAAWKARSDSQGGLDGLLKFALSGLNAMPPKGTCADCSDDELKAAIQHMSGL
ncbi:cytochrome c5 [Azomonas agilis]|uniref:Cytochrome c5 n=2 Tax=Azomonas agilis TaxID=116849 RepID=A0A562IZH7_9GAMM|nr:cytochrome c5 [Azomonas agilis]